MEDCIFCKIAKSVLPSYKIYEDDFTFAFLDINPVNPGHSLVIPKEHFKDFIETPQDIAHKLVSTVQKIVPAILRAVGADSFNIGINNGSNAGQIVFHTHVHIMPRFSEDGRNLWAGNTPQAEDLEKIAEEIIKNM